MSKSAIWRKCELCHRSYLVPPGMGDNQAWAETHYLQNRCDKPLQPEDDGLEHPAHVE